MIRSAATFVAVSLIATSAQAVTVWQGEAVIDTATAACNTIPSAPIRTDTVVKTVIKPKNVPGNSNLTSISFIANTVAMFALVLDDAGPNPDPSGTAAGFGHTSSGVIKPNIPIPYSQFVQSPPAVTASTPDITLSGRISDFLFVTNCDVTFRAAYTKRTN